MKRESRVNDERNLREAGSPDDREIAGLLHSPDPEKNDLGAELVVRMYELPCLRAAVRWVNDADEARDIMHEVMATFIERETDPVRASFEEGRSIEAYLITMVRHRVQDHFRRRQREEAHLAARVSPEKLLSSLSSGDMLAVDRLIVAEQRAIVQACLAKLSPEELRVLMARYGDETPRTQQLIADELGLAVSTINYRIKQALRHLKQLLEESGVRGDFNAGHE
jgi:RNA polymerase sigma factor (sigma-70 family)